MSLCHFLISDLILSIIPCSPSTLLAVENRLADFVPSRSKPFALVCSSSSSKNVATSSLLLISLCKVCYHVYFSLAPFTGLALARAPFASVHVCSPPSQTYTDFAGQGKMTLSANINYKSNYQNGALKAQRRNKWICALKTAMASLEIYGPADAGNPAPAPADPIAYTQVPYVAADKKDDKTTSAEPSKADVMKSGAQATAFTDPREVIDEEGGELTSADRKRL